MIIGIDASKAAVEKRTGVENFVFNLILGLQKVDTKNTYLLFTNKNLPTKLITNQNFKEILIPFPKFWNKLRLPLALLKYNPEKYIQPSYMIPALAPQKTLAVFHDLAWKKFPEAYSKKDILLNKQTIKNYFKKAQKIVCVSCSTQRDLVEIEPQIKNKTCVIYLASDKIKPVSIQSNPLDIKEKYFISIGRLEKRKNIKNTVLAFYEAKKQGLTHKLILVGKHGYGYEEIEEAISSNKDFAKDIIQPGYLQDEALDSLLCSAEALLYPSLYEGFGIPALEAMNLGIPVITSNTSSLPEVVGDSEVLVDPVDIEEMTNAILKIANNQEYRKNIIKKGFEQASKFSWEKTAQNFLKVLEEM